MVIFEHVSPDFLDSDGNKNKNRNNIKETASKSRFQLRPYRLNNQLLSDHSHKCQSLYGSTLLGGCVWRLIKKSTSKHFAN